MGDWVDYSGARYCGGVGNLEEETFFPLFGRAYAVGLVMGEHVGEGWRQVYFS